LREPDFVWPEQWQSQIQALIQRRAAIHLFSSLPEEATRAAHLIPCRDIAALVREKLARAPAAQIAVLPQGPLTIPYLAAAA
jgi:nickel-dependent lactate racemase